METEQALAFEPSRTLYDEADLHQAKLVAPLGLNEAVVRLISKTKNEPEWMLQKRLKGLKLFFEKPLPDWGPSLKDIDFDKITYFVDPNAKESTKWEDVPAEIRKTFDRLGIPEAEKKSLAGVGAQYDCLTEDTIVYTNPKGGVKIKDIKVGDHVFALDESTNKIVKAQVKGFMDKGIRPVFEVKLKGKKIKTTYNHPFLALVDKRKSGKQRARYSKEWKYLSELKKGDIVAVATDLPDYGKSFKFNGIKTKSIVKGKNQFGVTYDLDVSHSYKEVNLPKVSDNNLMWLFGHYLGDGYITKAKNKDKMRLNFAVHESQPEIKDKIKEIMKDYFGYEQIYEDKFRMTINSTKIALFFKENGFYGKAREKNMPIWVHSLPKEQKLALLAGYIDADGTVGKNNKDIILTSVNWGLLEQVKELSVYCGLTTSKITTFKSGLGNKIGHRIYITGRIKEMPCIHKTKKERLLSRITNIGKYNSLNGTTIRKYCSDSVGFSRIEGISYLGKEKVYDIEVEGHHNFVANGIIVHNSGVVYHQVLQSLKDKGVIFENMDVAVHKYPEMVQQYFMTSCIPINDHKFIMLHAAVWSGGTFIYIPKGVKVELPLQAYFRMNEKSGGQFEHTLIIVDEGAELHYVEGCSSPRYSTNSIHAGCVEIFVKEGAKMHYSSIENWSRNVYNCLSGNTRIYTANRGLIELKDILISDVVFALDIEDMKIKERRILQKWGKGKQKVYNIKFSNGSEIKATAEHPLLSFDKKNCKTIWKRVQELAPGELAWVPKEIAVNQEVTFKIKMERPKTNKYTYTQYPSTAVPEVMWLLGLYLGDGSRQFSKERGKYTAVVYSIPTSESIYTELKAIAKKYFGVEPTIRKDGVASTFSSVHFSKFIGTVGLEGKAYSKRIPGWVYKTSKENRLSFLAGIIDSDGHITKDGYVAQVINCNRNLLEDIRYLALSVGMGASTIIERDYPSTRKKLFIKGVLTCASESYILKLSNIQNLKPYLKKKESREKIKILQSKNKRVRANNYVLSRKTKLNLEEAGIVFIVSIQEAGTEEVYDIEVEELHNFIANGIIVKNCNTKRALVDKDATMIWVSGNMGSKVSMLYPCSVLRGSGAKSDSLGIAFAGEGQTQDIGAKAIHAAPYTTSTIHSKSISKNGGVSSYRGLVKIMPNAKGSKTNVVCDALILDEKSISNTYPHLKIDNHDVDAAHEARVGKISEETIFYLQSRGLSEDDAVRMIVSGFIQPIIRQLPLEYAVELNKLIEMEIEGF